MITCYALLRKVGSNLYLTPYLNTDKGSDLDSEEAVTLKSSGMLTKGQKDEASYALYRAIDFSVDRWIQDKQYIPRLLACAVVFVITYFFMSLAIRDPIPMVDEILISSALTIACWIFLAKRDTRSSLALQRRYELKGKAGSPDYQQKEEIFALEAFLQEVAELDMQDVSDNLCLVENKGFELLTEEQKGPWAEDFLSLLLTYLKTREKNLYRMVRRVLSVRENKKPNLRLSQRLFHLSMQQKIDLPLLTLTVILAQQVN
ncbi:MAG TPA: hypothetical protein VJ863_04010 [Sphaerochaeta sp.]|nr:hypothetical protein [Sphaerochaeta sp.]